MAQKSTERINFGKIKEVIAPPNLIEIQLDSYRSFLQADTPETERASVGLHAAFKTVFPISSYSGNATLEYVAYRLGEPVAAGRMVGPGQQCAHAVGGTGLLHLGRVGGAAPQPALQLRRGRDDTKLEVVVELPVAPQR